MKLTEMFVSKKTEEMIRLLYPKGEADRKIRKYRKEKNKVFTAVTTVAVLAALPLFLYDLVYSGKPIDSLLRNAYGKGAQTVTVNAVTDNGFREKIPVTVSERRYSEEQLREFSKRLDTKLWEAGLRI